MSNPIYSQPILPTQSPNNFSLKFKTRNDVQYGWLYYVFGDTDGTFPATANGRGYNNFYIPQAEFLPQNVQSADIYITQASVRIWGVQQLNGSWICSQVVKRISSDPAITYDSTGPELAMTYGGLIQQNNLLADPGVAFDSEDAILIERSDLNFDANLPNNGGPNPLAFPNPNPIFGLNTANRIWAFAMSFRLENVII
jgi:hypothetical protein